VSECSRCTAMQIDLENMEAELRAKRRLLTTLKQELRDATDSSPRMEEATRVYELWRVRCHHPRAIFSQDRKKLVLARLNEGYTQERLENAVRGAEVGAFEKDGHRYDDLELICRSGSQVEKFERKWVAWYEQRQQPKEIVKALEGLYGTVHDPLLDVFVTSCPSCFAQMSVRIQVNGKVDMNCTECGAGYESIRNATLYATR
jgi:hypothetical protein